MSAQLRRPLPFGENADLTPYYPRETPGVNGAGGMIEPDGVPWARYFEALRRHLLLIIVIVAAGSGLGLLAVRRVTPVYDVQSTVWIASGLSPQSGPISPQQLLPPASWIELLRSYSIIEPVVHSLKLNVHYKTADSVFFAGFESLPSLRPGQYVLTSEPGGHYSLSNEKKLPIERGTLGDSIGRKLGFAWAPPARLFGPGRILTFSVSTPRSASIALLAAMR